MTWSIANTLYIVSPKSWLRADHATLQVDIDRVPRLQIPFDQLQAVVIFGDGIVTPAAMGRLASHGIGVTYLDRNGRFQARVEGPVSGNVLLRSAQHHLHDNNRLELARTQVAGKLQNCRSQLLRSARDTDIAGDQQALRDSAHRLGELLPQVAVCPALDSLRGLEGLAAREYFSAFAFMIRTDRDHFRPDGRTRRPPLDRMNAMLSFLYALLTSDCVHALEAVGLDPQVGCLHVLRPGRPALALDLMEPLRPLFADRLALTLVNRKQLRPADFEIAESGAVHLSDNARSTVLTAWQERKREVVTHPELGQKLPLGLVPLISARLLARGIRHNPEQFVPYVPR